MERGKERRGWREGLGERREEKVMVCNLCEMSGKDPTPDTMWSYTAGGRWAYCRGRQQPRDSARNGSAANISEDHLKHLPDQVLLAELATDT